VDSRIIPHRGAWLLYAVWKGTFQLLGESRRSGLWPRFFALAIATSGRDRRSLLRAAHKLKHTRLEGMETSGNKVARLL